MLVERRQIAADLSQMPMPLDRKRTVDVIERAAQISILRALGFTGLGIGCVMLGLSYDPVLCFKTGAGLVMLTAVVLAWKGLEAPRRNIKHTELWIMLDGKIGLPKEHAQRLVGGLLRRLYYFYAEVALGVASVLWLLSLAIWILS